ncbi:uncharacterized protein LOC120129454 [Hibiscus syriacus]|uniref:uncharacterized protein LOC120129454 n=1 Tax=Hibiscus syriacus TaxID=106335 RepID=UPI001923B83B|nr:uncharacterized protein LOC120129454 [Hibiscus syriacus]
MAAPSKVGPAIYTDVYLNNQTVEDLNLSEAKDWYGSGKQPENVPLKEIRYFQHMADSDVGISEGGMAYFIKQNIQWIVVWRNMKDQDNKVYTDITTDSTINWDFYKEQLVKSDGHVEMTKLGYKSILNIDPYSVKPNVIGKLVRTNTA